MSDNEWMDRYPGAWRGPLSPGRPCLICKEPGYTVAAPADLPSVATLNDAPTSPALETADTCPGHEWVVRRYLAERFAPRLMAYKGVHDRRHPVPRRAPRPPGLHRSRLDAGRGTPVGALGVTERERELSSWNAYLATGSYREAGRRLGVHADTIRRHVAFLKAEYGVRTTAQLAVALEREKVA